jgi:hypothetical protein
VQILEKELFNENSWLSTSEPEETFTEGEKEVVHKRAHFKIKFDKKKAYTVYVKKGHEAKLDDKVELEESVYMALQHKFKDHFTMMFD